VSEPLRNVKSGSIIARLFGCSDRGTNGSIKINYGHEGVLVGHWMPDLPLKVIVHGWLDSTEHVDGVFSIKLGKKTAFVSSADSTVTRARCRFGRSDDGVLYAPS